MVGPKERERRIYRKDGNIFEVIMVNRDCVILQALDGLSQVLTGKKSFEFFFENALQEEGTGPRIPGKELL